jgi:hypothetical protein
MRAIVTMIDERRAQLVATLGVSNIAPRAIRRVPATKALRTYEARAVDGEIQVGL